MTAQKLAIAGSVAMLAMVTAVEAGAEDGGLDSRIEAAAAVRVESDTEAASRTGVAINLERSSNAGAAMAETVPPWLRAQAAAEAYRLGFESVRLARLGSAREGAAWKSIAAYAGVGRGLLRLSMDLGSGDINLSKEKRDRRDRLFVGMFYTVAPRTNLGLEYRALTGDDAFGQSAAEARSGLDDHSVLVNFQYRF